MALTAEQLEVTAQLERARASLGEALGQTQDISAGTGLDVDRISANLAGAVKNIFGVQSKGVADPASRDAILEAMDYLRNTLERLQEVPDEKSELEQITGSVARILALLYPVSKVLETLANAKPAGEKNRPSRISQMLPPGSERRTHERRIIQVDIGMHSNTNFFTGFSQDISNGGIFVATFDTIGIGEHPNVNFSLPSGVVLSVDGVVRWVREYNETTPDVEPGMGIQFETLDPNDKEAIDEFMETNPPLFYDND